MEHNDHCNHRHADCCDDQLPSIATFGRGPRGNSSHVRVGEPDSCTETYIEGWETDEQGNIVVKSEWRTENINGGELSYQYNLRPFTRPRTFTITFVYRRPGRCEWSWTTPAIPYIWSIDDAGVVEDAEHIVGSGVATLFIKTTHDEEWNERLKYPDGTTRDDFNAPLPDEAWAATITFGKGGDIEVPDFDDIAKIIGISKQDIYDILEDNSVTINGIDADNLIDYIDKCDRRDRDHFHRDLGFNGEGHGPEGAFGGHDTVKEYIDAKLSAQGDQINNLYQVVNQIARYIYGANVTTTQEKPPEQDGYLKITLPANKKIAVGDINVYSGNASPTTPAIRTRIDDQNNDLKGL